MSFGASGLSIVDVDPGATDASYELVLQPDGKIVAVGSSHQLFAVYRFMGRNTADLKVAGGTSTPTVGVGEPVAFTLTVTNIGPDQATEVAVTGSLSNLGLDAAPLTSSQGSCESGEPFVCNLGTMADGSVAIINYTALAAAEGSASSEISVTQYDDDPDTSDNNAVIAVDVVAAHASGTGDGSGTSSTDNGGASDGGGDGGDSGASGGCSLIR